MDVSRRRRQSQFLLDAQWYEGYRHDALRMAGNRVVNECSQISGMGRYLNVPSALSQL